MNKIICTHSMFKFFSRRILSFVFLFFVGSNSFAAIINAGSGGVRGAQPGSDAPYVGNNNDQPQMSKTALISGRIKLLSANANYPVNVVFVQEGRPKTVTVKTDGEGNYQQMLSEGVWTVRACNSALGYQPKGWRISVSNGEVSNFEALQFPAPEITEVNVDVSSDSGVIRAGDKVEIKGNGFACAGRVRVTVSGLDAAEVSNFKDYDDQRIVFDFPRFAQSNDGSYHIMLKAGFRFVQGALQSNLAEFETRLNAPDFNSINQPVPSPAAGSGSRTNEQSNKKLLGAPPRFKNNLNNASKKKSRIQLTK